MERTPFPPVENIVFHDFGLLNSRSAPNLQAHLRFPAFAL
jgi:hypothetical protein